LISRGALWIIVLVVRALYLLTRWMLADKAVQVEAPVRVGDAEMKAPTYTLTQNKDGTWVLK
jgi:hypothetical protein